MHGITQRSPVLAALPEQDQERLLCRAVPLTLDPGDVLFLAGDRGARVHLVVFGIVKLVARDRLGHEAVLSLAVPGDLIGELTSEGSPHPLDAVAATRTRLISFDSALVNELTAASPAAAMALASQLAARARLAYRAVLERSSKPARARLAARLLELAELLGENRDGAIELEIPITQSDLASLAGMCRESACKELRELKSSGVVDYRGRQLRILRPDALERIRCAERAGALCRSANAEVHPRSRQSQDT